MSQSSRGSIGLTLLFIAAAAAAPASGRDHQNSFMLMTPAQLYRLDGMGISADIDTKRAAKGIHTRLILAAKSTPSLYGSLQADYLSAGDGSGVTGQGAFKILDQLVLGIGLGWSHQHLTELAPSHLVTAMLSSEAALIKGEDYEAGLAIWQLRMVGDQSPKDESRHALLLHGRWLASEDFNLGVQARRAPHLSAQRLQRRWSYGLSANLRVHAWEVEALYNRLARRIAEDLGEAQHGTLMLYFAATPEWSLNLRLDHNLGSSTTQEDLSTSPSTMADGPRAGVWIGLGCARAL